LRPTVSIVETRLKGRITPHMKPEIHPDYDFVIFQDASTGYKFLTKSTLKSNKKATWEDGKEYPVFVAEISADSHPFFTGKQKILDAEGRVEKFMQKYNIKKK
jgi:large subunit ribosomal protein L31